MMNIRKWTNPLTGPILQLRRENFWLRNDTCRYLWHQTIEWSNSCEYDSRCWSNRRESFDLATKRHPNRMDRQSCEPSKWLPWAGLPWNNRMWQILLVAIRQFELEPKPLAELSTKSQTNSQQSKRFVWYLIQFKRRRRSRNKDSHSTSTQILLETDGGTPFDAIHK